MAKQKYWRRTIDSAQRIIGIPNPETSQDGLTGVTFEIQGMWLQYTGDREEFIAYPDMAENGIRTENEPPLSIIKRLFRREAKIGEVFQDQGTRIRLVLWTQPKVDLYFDLATDDGHAQWRETEIMVRSAGFHFRLPRAE